MYGISQRISLALILVSSAINCFADDDRAIRIAFPVAFIVGKNEAKISQLDIGSGLNADYLFLRTGRWHCGPGLVLSGSLPTARGNNKVSVYPYFLLGELRFLSAFDRFDNDRGFSPYAALGVQAGSLVISKSVNNSRRLDADFVYGGALTTGINYWLDRIGFGLSYGASISNMALRHKIEASLHFAP